LCFSFIKAEGKPVGKSLVDDTLLKTCNQITLDALNNNKTILFPCDYQIAQDSVDGDLSICSDTHFPSNAVGISVGPQSVDMIKSEIDKAKTIFFNCAMDLPVEKKQQRAPQIYYKQWRIQQEQQ